MNGWSLWGWWQTCTRTGDACPCPGQAHRGQASESQASAIRGPGCQDGEPTDRRESPWRWGKEIPAWTGSSKNLEDVLKDRIYQNKILPWQSCDLRYFISNSKQNKYTHNEIHHLPEPGPMGSQKVGRNLESERRRPIKEAGGHVLGPSTIASQAWPRRWDAGLGLQVEFGNWASAPLSRPVRRGCAAWVSEAKDTLFPPFGGGKLT